MDVSAGPPAEEARDARRQLLVKTARAALDADLLKSVTLKEQVELEFLEALGIIAGEKGGQAGAADAWRKKEARPVPAYFHAAFFARLSALCWALNNAHESPLSSIFRAGPHQHRALLQAEQVPERA